MNLIEAANVTGTLSRPSKMPCQSYSIPASECRVGQRLAEVKNSVCAGCYAMRGNYRYENVKSSQAKRFESLRDPQWVPAMVVQILMTESSGYFRWHDSGDLQGVWHLENIVAVCKLTPGIRHWLPTREYSIVREFVRSGGVIPANLTIRLSAYLVDGPAPERIASELGCVTSTVVTSGPSCPAPNQGNKCLTCRACWDRNVSNVAYRKH